MALAVHGTPDIALWRTSSVCRFDMEELSLKCQSSTQLHVLFGEPWLVQINHVKLRGTVPYDRWGQEGLS